MRIRAGVLVGVLVIFNLEFQALAIGQGSDLLRRKNGETEKLLKAEFFREPSLPPATNLQAPPPSFEGKVLVKDDSGRWVPVQRPSALPPGSTPATTAPADALAADIYIQDGSETALAINYDNGNNLVASYNDGWNFDPDIPHSNSTNGNVSWINRTFPVGGGTYTGYPFDPWANPGNAAGEFFSTLIRNDGAATNNSHCIVSRSTDNGASFSFFFERVKSVFQDRQMFDVDKTSARGGGSGTTHDGKVYLCYDDIGAGNTGYAGSFLQIISSAGAAITELQITDLTGPFEGSQMQPVAGITDGTLYIQGSAISSGGAAIHATFHEITNAGAGPNTILKSTFSWPATGQQLGTTARWGLNGARIDNHGYLDIDRSSGPRRGHLFFITNRNPNPGNPALDQGDVYLSVSSDGATNWSSAAIPTAAGKTQYFPMLDVDEYGLIHVAYYQNEAGLTNGGVLNAGSANLYYTLSMDGGSTWTAPVQINTVSGTLDMEDPPPNRSAANYYLNGDYAQLQATGTGASTRVYVLWSGYDKDRNNAFVGDKKERVYCTTYLPPVCGLVGPGVNCPNDTSVSTSGGQCNKAVSFAPVFSDNCPGATLNCTPPSGFSFSLGATLVTCIATDADGLKDTCQFSVTVTDTTPPAAQCPADTTIKICPAATESTLAYSTTASDNCSVNSLVCTPPSGSAFPVGSSPVTCIAIDASGNQDTCTFTVTTVNLLKGDMNASGGLSPADVVLMLSCVFLGTGNCDLCYADVNCSGGLSPADVVIELNMVFLSAAPGC